MIVLFDVAARALSLSPSSSPYGDLLTATINRHGQTVPMSGVRFGLTATINGEQTLSQSWPPPGVSYSRTDQDTLASCVIEWLPDDVVEINAWLIDSLGVRHEASVTFVAPRPPQPYPSWLWAANEWHAPVPYPQGVGAYEWDEGAQTWIPMAL